MQVKYYIHFTFCTQRGTIMSINFLDTVTTYYPCPFDLRKHFTTHWIWDNTDSNYNLHHYCIKTPHCFVRYFPDMFGYRRLYVTFSLPKLYYQCNKNTFNVNDYDNVKFLDTLYNELGTVIDRRVLPSRLKMWQPSRIDPFRMRAINPTDRLEYHSGYGRLMYRGVRSTTYKNTNYLPCSLHSKLPCIILRSYNKTKEEQDKESLLYGFLPALIEEEHELLMKEMDIPDEQYRYEFSLRRNAIIKYCDKRNLPVNMETVMDETFQKQLLNELVVSRGLHFDILSKKDFRKIAPHIFRQQRTIDNALKLAEAIRNKKSIPLTSSQQYRIKHELNSYFINTATTNFVSIKGLELL